MTLPENLPPKFRTAARDFADTLRASFASGMPAQPEDQLKGPVQALLATVTRGVLTKTEVRGRVGPASLVGVPTPLPSVRRAENAHHVQPVVGGIARRITGDHHAVAWLQGVLRHQIGRA